MPPELLGPTGALVAVLFGIAALARAIVVLWQEHLKADQDDRDERNRANDLLALSLQNNKAAIAAWDRRNAADAARRRKEDA